MTEREELLVKKAEAEKQIEKIYKSQKELQGEILKIIREEIPALEVKSGSSLRNGGEFEEINDEIRKLKRFTKTMDNQISQKGEEMDRLRHKVEVLDGELSKLPEPVEATNNDKENM